MVVALPIEPLNPLYLWKQINSRIEVSPRYHAETLRTPLSGSVTERYLGRSADKKLQPSSVLCLGEWILADLRYSTLSAM